MATSLSGALSSSEGSGVAAWDTTSSGHNVEGIAAGSAMCAGKAALAAYSVRC
jgi:hypothetical protein